MSIIDIHTHAFPDKISKRAMSHLESMTEDWAAVGQGTVRDLLKFMDNTAVDVSAICGIATKPGQWSGILDWLLGVMGKHRERIVPFASVHPQDENIGDALMQIKDAGIYGIKLHPMHQDFIADADEVMEIYQQAAWCRLAVQIHSGRDIGFPNDAIPDRASPKRIANVLDRVDGLRILCTHMGGWRSWDEVEECLVGRDVYMETSFALGHMDDEQFLRIVKNHTPDRVCFGSDWPWNDPGTELAKLESLGLSAGDLEKIKFSSSAAFLELSG
ncbi:MAG: amidohydrolase family protein [Phycisphaerae bacterium]|nr:amidohydrolase family protein [Phycisphaerae bacterium]